MHNTHNTVRAVKTLKGMAILNIAQQSCRKVCLNTLFIKLLCYLILKIVNHSKFDTLDLTGPQLSSQL